MDAPQMMMASGGMIALVVTLVSLLVPLIMLILLWKISKATGHAVNQLERLIAQVDQLVQSSATAPAPAGKPAAATGGPAGYDLLAPVAKVAAPAEASQESHEDAFTTEAPAVAGTSAWQDTGDTGFEFPAEEEAFDDFSAASGETDGFPPAAESSADDLDDDFDFPLDEEFPASTEEDLASDFGIEEPAASEDLNAEEEAPLGEAFDTAADQSAPPAEAFGPAIEEKPPAAQAEEEAEGEAEPAPAIVKLDDDPARPEVSMARCGNCDHKLAYKKSLAGRKARCPSCKEAFILP